MTESIHDCYWVVYGQLWTVSAVTWSPKWKKKWRKWQPFKLLSHLHNLCYIHWMSVLMSPLWMWGTYCGCMKNLSDHFCLWASTVTWMMLRPHGIIRNRLWKYIWWWKWNISWLHSKRYPLTKLLTETYDSYQNIFINLIILVNSTATGDLLLLSNMKQYLTIIKFHELLSTLAKWHLNHYVSFGDYFHK